MTLPLVIDLDGTLVRSDTLIESVFALLGDRRVLGHIRFLVTGNPAMRKRIIAQLAALAPHLLPYNEQLLAYLRLQKAAGRSLILATASDRALADAVATHLGLFDEVVASDGVRNLKGRTKAAALADRFGPQGFTYAGNSRNDLPVWRAAGSAIIVNASHTVTAAARRETLTETEINDRGNWVRAVGKTMRPHQWLKNLLVFVPVVTAQAYWDLATWIAAALMFVAFCCTASGVYIFNDLIDLAADRAHPRKRLRGFASGMAPLPVGLVVAGLLFALGLGIAILAGTGLVIVLYVTITVLYSIVLKEQPLIDVFCLAALYVLRVLGGGAATGHALSFWLLGFSGFLFLSLALVKRVEELQTARNDGERRINRRGYGSDDLPLLQVLGCSSTFASSVVLALYVQADAVMQRYAAPGLLWGIVPLLLFWQCRLWLSTARGYMHDDPIIYAARDWVSWLVAAALIVILVVAKSAKFLAF